MTTTRERGPATEALIYRLIDGSRRRTLVDHITATSDYKQVLRSKGPGRYRVEWRDARRWIVAAQGYWVYPNGRVEQVRGRRPPRRPRKLGQPRRVPHQPVRSFPSDT
jgi:hypothetical protein